MPNYTFKIQQAKIFNYGSKQTKAWGELHWTDGTADFKQKFETINPQVMTIIGDNRSAEASFKVSGSMTINVGYGDHKGKIFQTHVVNEIEVI